MVTLQNNLEWNLDELNQKGIDLFLRDIDKVLSNISRGEVVEEKNKKDCRINVQFHLTQTGFIVSPAEGKLEYQLKPSKEFSISYVPEGTYKNELMGHECIRRFGEGTMFYFLTKPLDNL